MHGRRCLLGWRWKKKAFPHLRGGGNDRKREMRKQPLQCLHSQIRSALCEEARFETKKSIWHPRFLFLFVTEILAHKIVVSDEGPLWFLKSGAMNLRFQHFSRVDAFGFWSEVFIVLLMRPQQRRFLAVESSNLWSYNSSAELPSSAGPQEAHTHTHSHTCMYTHLLFSLLHIQYFLALNTHSLPPPPPCVFQMCFQFFQSQASVSIPSRLNPLVVVELPLSEPCDPPPTPPNSSLTSDLSSVQEWRKVKGSLCCKGGYRLKHFASKWRVLSTTVSKVRH